MGNSCADFVQMSLPRPRLIGRASKCCQPKCSKEEAVGFELVGNGAAVCGVLREGEKGAQHFPPGARLAVFLSLAGRKGYSLGINSVVPAWRRWVLPMPFILRIRSTEAP